MDGLPEARESLAALAAAARRKKAGEMSAAMAKAQAALPSEEEEDAIRDLMAARNDPGAAARAKSTSAVMLAQLDPEAQRRYRNEFAETVREYLAALDDKNAANTTLLSPGPEVDRLEAMYAAALARMKAS